MPRWAWLASLSIACGQPAPASQPRTPEPRAAAIDAGVDASPGQVLAADLPRLALRARQLYLDWAAAFSDPNLDCATATARVSALAEMNADVAEANKAVFRGGHERVRAFRVELEKYEAELAPSAKAIMESPIMSRCSTDPQFSRSIDRLQGDA